MGACIIFIFILVVVGLTYIARELKNEWVQANIGWFNLTSNPLAFNFTNNVTDMLHKYSSEQSEALLQLAKRNQQLFNDEISKLPSMKNIRWEEFDAGVSIDTLRSMSPVDIQSIYDGAVTKVKLHFGTPCSALVEEFKDSWYDLRIDNARSITDFAVCGPFAKDSLYGLKCGFCEPAGEGATQNQSLVLLYFQFGLDSYGVPVTQLVIKQPMKVQTFDLISGRTEIPIPGLSIKLPGFGKAGAFAVLNFGFLEGNVMIYAGFQVCFKMKGFSQLIPDCAPSPPLQIVNTTIPFSAQLLQQQTMQRIEEAKQLNVNLNYDTLASSLNKIFDQLRREQFFACASLQTEFANSESATKGDMYICDFIRSPHIIGYKCGFCVNVVGGSQDQAMVVVSAIWGQGETRMIIRHPSGQEVNKFGVDSRIRMDIPGMFFNVSKELPELSILPGLTLQLVVTADILLYESHSDLSLGLQLSVRRQHRRLLAHSQSSQLDPREIMLGESLKEFDTFLEGQLKKYIPDHIPKDPIQLTQIQIPLPDEPAREEL